MELKFTSFPRPTLLPMSEPLITPAPIPDQDENQLIAERREKLKVIRQQQAAGKGVAFPNDFKPTDRADALFAAHAGQTRLHR